MDTSTPTQSADAGPSAPAAAAGGRGKWAVRLLILGVMGAGAALGLGVEKMRANNIRDMADSPPTRARADILFLESRVRYYTRVMGKPPPDDAGLKSLVAGGLLRDTPIDPWGRPYLYRYAGNSKGIVFSYGRDGREGGTGEDADVYSPMGEP